MKKTLGDLLKERKYLKANVKIGSKGGSSFWYCGKANLLYSKPIITNIIEPKLMKQNQKTLDMLNERLDKLDELYEHNLASAKKRKVKNLQNYAQQLNAKKAKEKLSLPKKIKSVEEDLNTTLLKREVREVREGILQEEKPCWIVYIKGNERGAYWTISEYDKKNTKRRNIYDY